MHCSQFVYNFCMDTTQSLTGNVVQPTASEPSFEIDGEKVSLSTLKEWKANGLRQSDYTRKTQELAQQRKELESKQIPVQADDDLERAKAILKQSGFVTREDLDAERQKLLNEQSEKERARQLESELSKNQSFSSYKPAIEAMMKIHPDKSIDEILVLGGFIDQSKLEKANSRNEVWSFGQRQEKSIEKMSDEEYEEYRKSFTWSNFIKSGNSKF